MIPAAAIDLLGRTNGLVRGGHGEGRPSLARDVHLAEAILAPSGTTNGQVAVQGWRDLERRTGVELADLAGERAGERISFADTQVQPRAVITSPEWSGSETGGVTPRSSSMSSARSRGTRHVRHDGLGLPAGQPVGPAGLHRHWRAEHLDADPAQARQSLEFADRGVCVDPLVWRGLNCPVDPRARMQPVIDCDFGLAGGADQHDPGYLSPVQCCEHPGDHPAVRLTGQNIRRPDVDHLPQRARLLAWVALVGGAPRPAGHR
jgi:hypothetical protein